jgi:succinate dehydrogenase/fumarate reductase flavoprotein subunit
MAMKYHFEVPPKPISDSEIVDTHEADVIVIGAGTSGLVCANSAVENSLKVTLITASKHSVGRGGSIHAINSKLMRELGVNYDIGKNIKQEIDRSGGRIDQNKWYLFAKKSGEAMDWLIEKMSNAGYRPVLESREVDPDGLISAFPGSHSFIGKDIKRAGTGQPFVVKALANLAQSSGVKIFYETRAIQLIRKHDNTGRVTAVIAETSDGKYIKYVGLKAIVLATGDFTKDKEMVAKYCPEVLPLVSDSPVNYNSGVQTGGIYSGDGHKMGLWIGAAWQQAVPNAPMLVSRTGPASQPHGSFKGLLVNKTGVRFCNEDASRAQIGFMQMRQPDWKILAIWDSMYAKKRAPWRPLGSYLGGPNQSVSDVVKEWDTSARIGKTVEADIVETILKKDTIEEVAEGFGIDVNKLRATVNRYNKFCINRLDEDYFKRAELLIPTKEKPFYGMSSTSPKLLIVCGGLRTNLKMQVIDVEGKVIPGLFAVGTIVGDMFANYYSFMPSGMNLGANCVTFGYLAGKEIANS